MSRWLSRNLPLPKTASVATIVSLVLVTGTVAAVPSYAKSQRDQVVFVGDSITFGLGSSNPLTRSRPALFDQKFGAKVDVLNKGISGITLSAIAPSRDMKLLYRPGARNVAVVLAGTNDLDQGTKAASLYPMLRTYATALEAGGWKVIVGTILARHLPASKERERIAFNKMIKSGELAKDGIVVIDYTPAQAQGRIPLSDPVHPNDTGYVTMAGLERPQIERLLQAR